MTGRRWLFVPYDQLTDRLGPLSRENPRELGIVLVENPTKAERRPYHKQKLALVISNLRHFAREQEERGVAVRRVLAEDSYAAALTEVIEETGALQMMEAAERELRVDLEPLVDAGRLEILPHEGWLTTNEDFEASRAKSPQFKMDSFYRAVRKRTGILMEDGKPAGGKWSFDSDNRKPWRGDPPAPKPPRFPMNDIKREVGDLIERRFAHHPGELDLGAIPATREDAELAWAWAKDEALTHFGPYEDAMSTKSRTLFHTRISALLNLHRLTPKRLLDDVLALDVPLASKEGFVRQLLGWREFVRQVHRHTDGFRTLKPEGAPNFLNATQPLPPAYWGETSGLHCLDEVVRGVWEEGYGHHITRLMILSNVATLLDVNPRELTDWFWVGYTDAYDWVVEPNVLAMGSYAAADLMTTKPYVSGAAYIHRMSDYCGDCAFDPKKNCPITPMYWAFLERHRETLADNPRLTLPYRSLQKRGKEDKNRDAEIFQRTRDALAAGEQLRPDERARRG